MKSKIETIIDADRFRMKALAQSTWPEIENSAHDIQIVTQLKRILGQRYETLKQAILRHVFLIELVKIPAIETTKFRTRWFPQLNGDPRFCSFDECLSIAHGLLADLVDFISESENKELIKLCFENSLLPYEIPLDYIDRPIGSRAQNIHNRGNLIWTSTPIMLRTLRLRKFLTGDQSPDRDFFKAVLDNKIRVKTYLTDRVLTGNHKTNREKRWEVNPNSVHYASRRTCMEIEYNLIKQLCDFEGFPNEARVMLQEQGLLPPEVTVFKCPITLDPMSFEAFRAELLNPRHGRSDFQVGHLNPLKLDDPTAAASGHSSQNISWISADGNRIQGSLGLTEVRNMLSRISSNYASVDAMQVS